MFAHPRFTAALLLMLALAGCAAPTLDAGDDAAWAASVQDVRDDLAPAQRGEFDAALVTLAAVGAGDDAAVPDLAEAANIANPVLHGFDAPAVIAAAVEQQRVIDAAELARLRASRDAVTRDREAVAGVSLLEQAFYVREGRQFLDLLLENEGALHVGQFVVLLTLRMPGEAKPAMHQTFTVRPGAAIEPGTKHATTLTPVPDSPWGRLRPPPGSTLVAVLVSVRDTTGRNYATGDAFSEEDARRLAELEAAAR